MPVDVEQIAVLIRDSVRDLPTRYSENKKRIRRLDEETSDLMHLVELTRFNAFEGFKIAQQLQVVRQERRKLKDENEVLKHLAPYLQSQKNKLGQLDKAIGEIRNTKSRLPVRKYNCKVRKDLEQKINGG